MSSTADVKKSSDIRSGGDRRIEIIDISTRMFLDHGFAGTSMSQLADACGIRKASFYHHFRSKDELFIQCVIKGYESALVRLAQLEQDDALTHDERVSHALEVLYEVTVNSPAGKMSPLIAEVSRSMPELSERFFNEYILLQRETLMKMVQRGVGAGKFIEPDSDVFYHLVFGPIVTLSLSRAMFTTLPDLDVLFPTEKLKKGHCDAILAYLARPRNGTSG